MTEFLTLFDKYGISFTITGLVIYFLSKIFNLGYKYMESKILTKKNDNYTQELKELFPKKLEADSQINEILTQILYKFGAGRIILCEYHNGGASIAGIPFLKASCTYEKVNKGISPMQQYLQNMFMGMNTFWNRKIMNQENIRYPDIRSIQNEDIGAYMTLSDWGVKSYYCLGLYDDNDFPIGYINIYFIGIIKDIDDRDWHELKEDAFKISQLLQHNNNK